MFGEEPQIREWAIANVVDKSIWWERRYEKRAQKVSKADWTNEEVIAIGYVPEWELER